MPDNIISIIVPCYNAEKFIGKTIDAIKNQTYSQLEVIFIDDGSTDNTYKIINQAINGDDRLKVYTQKNRGVSFSRNRGIRKSSGTNICFIDSDDIIREDYIENFVMFSDGPQTVVSCGIKKFSEENLVNTKTKELQSPIKLNSSKEILEYFYPFHNIEYFGSVVNKCYPRELLIENKIYFDEKLNVGEDLSFNLSLLGKVKKWYILSNQFYYYRVNKGSLTFSFKSDYLNMRMTMISNLKKIFLEQGLSEVTLYSEYVKAAYSQLMALYYTDNNLSVIEKNQIINDVKRQIPEKIRINRLKADSIQNRILFSFLLLPNFILKLIVMVLAKVWVRKMKKVNNK